MSQENTPPDKDSVSTPGPVWGATRDDVSHGIQNRDWRDNDRDTTCGDDTGSQSKSDPPFLRKGFLSSTQKESQRFFLKGT